MTKANKLLKGLGFTVLVFMVIGCLLSILFQLIKNLTYPYRVPLSFSVSDLIEPYIRVPFGIMIVIILTSITIVLTYGKGYLNQDNDERNFTYSKHGTYGTSRWMDLTELKKYFKLTEPKETLGIILGKKDGKIVCLPPDTISNKNIAVYGAPGSRKSRSFVRPMIFERMKAGESMVVTDPKGELYRDTAELLRKNGYNVKVFNLKAFENSDSWNCLGEIDGPQRDINATIFTDTIIKNTSNEFNTNDFWDNAEHNLLKALVLYVGASPSYRGKRTIGEVYRLVTQQGIDRLDEIFNRLEPTDAAIMPYNIFAQAGNLRPNIIVGLGTRIQVFQNAQVVNATSLPDIDLLKPGTEKTVYYVITSDQSGTFNFLASLFFSFLFIKLIDYADSLVDGKLPIPVYFIMDEFPNIGTVPDFEKKISTVRSRNISISIIFQNLAQMKNRYIHGVWEEILGNCDTHLFLGCTDQTTAEYISLRTGEVTIVALTYEEHRKRLAPLQYIPEYKLREGEGRRMLLTMDEVLRLDPNELILISNAKPVVKLTKYDFTEHPLSEDISQTVHTDHVPIWRQREIEAEQLIKEELSEEAEVITKETFMGKETDLLYKDTQYSNTYPDKEVPQTTPKEPKENSSNALKTGEQLQKELKMEATIKKEPGKTLPVNEPEEELIEEKLIEKELVEQEPINETILEPSNDKPVSESVDETIKKALTEEVYKQVEEVSTEEEPKKQSLVQPEEKILQDFFDLDEDEDY